MLKTFRTVSILRETSNRLYSLCCPPRKPCNPCPCPPPVPRGSKKIKPPTTCRPSRIPPNPCCPHYPKTALRFYKYLALFGCFPLILFQMFLISGCKHGHKTECRDYEYMRRRSKKYPWGDGNETLFHNPDVNFLPGECVEPPLDCD